MQTQSFYALIERKYRGKIARRSGLSYLNHIREGALILHLLGCDNAEITEAYCLHPLFQSDRSLVQISRNEAELSLISPYALVLAMEYRRVANAYTIKHQVRPVTAIDIGPLPEVHQMLVADKIQNKKDFVKHIQRKQDRPSF